MRLAAIASALAIVVCAAIFGAIFFQKASVSGPAATPAMAAPEEPQARTPTQAVTTIDNPAPTTNATGTGTAPTMVAQAAPAPGPAPAPIASVTETCTNPNALGISRVVEIDTTGGPAFGSEKFREYDF